MQLTLLADRGDKHADIGQVGEGDGVEVIIALGVGDEVPNVVDGVESRLSDLCSFRQEDVGKVDNCYY